MGSPYPGHPAAVLLARPDRILLQPPVVDTEITSTLPFSGPGPAVHVDPRHDTVALEQLVISSRELGHPAGKPRAEVPASLFWFEGRIPVQLHRQD
jgi:hypothetical protein